MELKGSQEDVGTLEETSFSRTTDTPYSLQSTGRGQKDSSVKMCKVQVSFRQKGTDRPDGKGFLRTLGRRFLYFVPISQVSPQKASNIHAIY
ncbi:hypothetical protein KSD_70090 [Ktedonobacter sp. SOSP1-85]|nr:hypothetical protein KSD_70090 [Ktedonobacter sp. SOSP1-85]